MVIGAGPNGLVAAVTLANQGWKVLVLEEQSRPGGAVYSVQNTLPGFWHDVGAAFFPFASTSPAFRALNLEGAGLEWRHGRRDSCHPAPDGSCATISRDLELSRASFGVDGDAWVKLSSSAPPEHLLKPAAWRLGWLFGSDSGLFRLTQAGLSSPRAFPVGVSVKPPAAIPGLACWSPDDFAERQWGSSQRVGRFGLPCAGQEPKQLRRL